MDSLIKRVSLNAKDLRATRVKNAVSTASVALRTKVFESQKKLLKYIGSIERLLDLGAKSTTDIATNLSEFDSTTWAEQLEGNVLECAIRYSKLKTLTSVYNALFPDEKIEDITISSDILGLFENYPNTLNSETDSIIEEKNNNN